MAAAPLPPMSADLPSPETAPPSEGARIISTFIAPSKTFADLRRNASWWGPWLLISLISLLFVYSMDRQIGFDQISKNEIEHSSRADQFDKLPADQQARQISFSSSLVRYLSYGIPVMILLYFAVTSLVLWATFKFGAGRMSVIKPLMPSFFMRRCQGLLDQYWAQFRCLPESVPRASTLTIRWQRIRPTSWIQPPINFSTAWPQHLMRSLSGRSYCWESGSPATVK